MYPIKLIPDSLTGQRVGAQDERRDLRVDDKGIGHIDRPGHPADAFIGLNRHKHPRQIVGAVHVPRPGNVLVRIPLVFRIHVQRPHQPLFPKVALRLKPAMQFRQADVGDSDWGLSRFQRRGARWSLMHRGRLQVEAASVPAIVTGSTTRSWARRVSISPGHPGVELVRASGCGADR